MSRILFFAEYPMLVELARRLAPGAAACGDTLTVCTNRLSSYLLARRAGLDVVLVKSATAPADLRDHYDARNHEVGAGYLDPVTARHVYESFVAAGHRLITSDPAAFSLILAWNGGLVSSRAARCLADGHQIPLLFMEIANMRGRMLFDPDGSACDTSAAKRPEILDRYQIDDAAAAAWIEAFIAQRRKATTVPQAKLSRSPNLWFAVDLLGRFFNVAPAFSVGPWHRANNFALRHRYEPILLKRAVPTLPDRPFVFLPLQVSTDTNLICRSEIDNFAAIDTGLAEAKRRGAAFVIKLHPAEREGYFMRRLVHFLADRPDVIITTANTILAVDRSILVMTINSTVGLEARLLGKETLILQPALYSAWTNRQVAQFALRYTVPFDLYATDQASATQWQEIKARVPRPVPSPSSATVH